jgi:hypothetical protein
MNLENRQGLKFIAMMASMILGFALLFHNQHPIGGWLFAIIKVSGVIMIWIGFRIFDKNFK